SGPRAAHNVAAAYNGYLYIVGGYNQSAAFSDVQYAPINSDGTIGSWVATTSMETGRGAHSLVVSNGYMYIMGGYDYVTGDLNTTYYAPINSNGTLGTWVKTASLATTH